MKTLTLFLLLLSSALFGQSGEWTWMHGDSIPNPSPVYGITGIADPANKPPGRYEAAEWTDHQGNFWMFGGNGLTGIYNDLWKFNPLLNQWTWMKGSNTVNQPGTYGTQGIASPANTPGARGFGIATWVDNSGDLWLFGGNGYDASGTSGLLNDLWKYDVSTNNWTWMKGASSVNHPGLYGTILVAAPLSNPKSRHETNATWVDNSGNLWLFGGENTGAYNDLWKYEIPMNQWTWMKGDSIPNTHGIYGTIGVSSATNTPGARWVFSKWQTQPDVFYLFGGQGRDATGAPGRLNDLWEFNVATNQWTWINGSNTANPPGAVESLCSSEATNQPSGRMENRATWKDACNNLIMFGGYNANGWYNDLWSYNISSDKWNWISGDSLPDQPGVYGTLLVSDPLNKPCARWGSVGWKDQSGNLWLFGGHHNSSSYRNDMWKYSPDEECQGCLTTGINDHKKDTQNKVYPNPANDHATLQFDNPAKTSCMLTLYDSQGRLVRSMSNITDDQVEIQKQNLMPGIYFYRLLGDSQIIATGKLRFE